MIHGALKALRTHGHHSTTPHPGSWSFRAGRSRLKPRQAQRYRCSLIYKLPIFRMLGASARYSRLCVPVETSTPPRRGEIRFTPFPAAPKTAFRSFAPPSPHWTRSAGLQRGPLCRRGKGRFAPSPRFGGLWGSLTHFCRACCVGLGFFVGVGAWGRLSLYYSMDGGRIVLRFGDIFISDMAKTFGGTTSI